MDERVNQYTPAVTARAGLTAQAEELPMIGAGGPQESRVWFSIDFWLGVSEYVAVAFASVADHVQVAVGLVVYAPLTAERLRELNMRELTGAEPNWPRWERSEAPSPDELRNRWIIQVERGHKDDVEAANPQAPTRERLQRKPGQDPDEFYAEVARYYRAFQATTSKPTTSIAKAAGVSRNTAAQWVHLARKRGHLPPVEKGE